MVQYTEPLVCQCTCHSVVLRTFDIIPTFITIHPPLSSLFTAGLVGQLIPETFTLLMKLQNKMASIVKSVGNIEHEVYPSNHYLATTTIYSNHYLLANMLSNHGYCLPL